MNSTFVHSSGLPVGTDMISAEALSPSKFQTNIFGSRSRGENMAMYIPISNVHAETMQTLYLMNPAVAGYTDTLTPGNVMLISNAANTTVTVSDFSCNDQEQRHSFQMTIPTASGSRQSPIGGGGNELTFLEPINTSSTSQSFNGHLNSSIGLCHANVADISPVGLQLHNLSGINEQSSLSPSQLSLQLDQPETMTGQRKGPTLSLSPHDPSGFQMLSFQKSTAEFNVNCPGIIQAPLENSFRVDNSGRGGMIANGISDPSHSFDTNKQSQFNLDRLAGFSSLRNSKYLRVTQELLNEVSNPGKEDNFNLTKCRNASLSSETAAEKEDDAKECGGKSTVIGTKQAQQNSVEESGKSNKIELNVAERQELQIKKTKLMAMLDEVDQRYKQYHHQMQIVVSCFEAVTHIGAAKTYTSLALKTISRHFRCLRDAIASQIHRTGKVLNECNVSPNGKDDASRLRLVDQQLRQQRALQKLGMIQPNAWRPQRGLPDRAVSVLRAWLFEHFLHPYPKDSDKVMLAKQAGLTRSQVSNWFINARVRLWKPMVEEMYMEELKEAGLSVIKNNTAPDDEKAVALSEEDSAKRENEYDSHVQHEQDIDSQYGVSEHPMHVGDRVSNARQPPDLRHNTNCRLSSKGVSTDEIPTKTSVEVDGQGNFKKARNEYEDSAESFLQNSSNKLVNTRAAERSPDSFCEKKFIDERYTGANYSLLHNDIVLSGNDANSGQYQFECLNRLANGSFISRLSGGSISLTLGLKQSESFLLSEPQESCLPSEPRSAELGQLGNSYCNINDTTPV